MTRGTPGTEGMEEQQEIIVWPEGPGLCQPSVCPPVPTLPSLTSPAQMPAGLTLHRALCVLAGGRLTRACNAVRDPTETAWKKYVSPQPSLETVRHRWVPLSAQQGPRGIQVFTVLQQGKCLTLQCTHVPTCCLWFFFSPQFRSSQL